MTRLFRGAAIGRERHAFPRIFAEGFQLHGIQITDGFPNILMQALDPPARKEIMLPTLVAVGLSAWLHRAFHKSANSKRVSYVAHHWCLKG